MQVLSNGSDCMGTRYLDNIQQDQNFHANDLELENLFVFAHHTHNSSISGLLSCCLCWWLVCSPVLKRTDLEFV